MKKVIVIILFILLSFSSSFSQIGKIKDIVNSTTEAASESVHSNSYNNFWLDLLFNEVVFLAVDVLAHHHHVLLDSTTSNTLVRSVDIMPTIGINPTNNQYSFIPRVRGTWGIFSSDLRLNMITEMEDFTADTYQTLDWQVLVFSTYPSDRVNLRFGSGIFYDIYTQEIHNQHYAGLEVYFLNKDFSTVIEGRYTTNYYSDSPIYNETNLTANYKFFNKENIHGYFTFGGIYQNYYSVEFVSLLAGVKFNIH